jgi:hypothetical protein
VDSDGEFGFVEWDIETAALSRTLRACAAHTVRLGQTAQHPAQDQAAGMVGAISWYHSFDLRPGLRTAGVSEMPAAGAFDALQVRLN